jgi:hypothetical protein
MGHASIENETPFAFTTSFAIDEEGRPLLVPLLQATYEIHAGRALSLAAEQLPPSLTGELWGADAATSSYRIEPAFAFIKPATDVALVGHAQAPQHPVPDLQVVLRVGPVGKVVRVVGDRLWVRAMGAISATRPQPFERVPLTYERAFGGWDRSLPDPKKHAFEPKNPVGTGFRMHGGSFEEGVRLPNLEELDDPLHHYGQAIKPAGFGFLSPNWQPRASLAGTYDEAWSKDRMPLLPRDFDRRFFSAASAGLVAPGYLAGNEPVLVENASPMGRLSFNLPGLRPPTCRVELARVDAADVEMRLDTVIVDTDNDRVLLLYRGHLALRDGPHDVRSIAIHPGEPPTRAQVPGSRAAPAWAR